ncbi:hypothetical protein [Actinophytocola gossypii]|uniref:Uncharacterized protein n=1 Tax=Actinophytocola gossypii TaxID=2812003 RepID=A0ABT2J158_9PSEU|nr:hypothetical protein [Actinophytocola gossypii]MCT2581592.1 hypothetical protein [Actinophytocola gossypii]
MLADLVVPGTATYDPEFADQTLFVLGLHGQVFLAIVLLLTLSGAVVATLRMPAAPLVGTTASGPGPDAAEHLPGGAHHGGVE